ncbi:hypothetical protein [Streptomyces sp. NPDC046862]|uniref:hypothetical protein n=1 Tax=Streptomyces sp. NPDC046862 TaxID=3154603 RepID=UPI00345209D3
MIEGSDIRTAGRPCQDHCLAVSASVTVTPIHRPIGTTSRPAWDRAIAQHPEGHMSALMNTSGGGVLAADDQARVGFPAREVDLVVIGASATGVYQLRRAREAGFSVSLLETDTVVDGAWRSGRTFDEGPPEQLDNRYQLEQMDRFGLRRHLRFGASAGSVVYHESSGTWLVTTAESVDYRARFVVVAPDVVPWHAETTADDTASGCDAVEAPGGSKDGEAGPVLENHLRTHTLKRLGVRGREGLALAGYWADGPRTYLGVMTAGFPNFFFPGGPHSTRGHRPRRAADQVDFVTGALVHAREHGCEVIEVGLSAEEEWTNLMNRTATPLFLGHHVFEATATGEPAPALSARSRQRSPIGAILDDEYAGFVFSKAESAV